MSQRSVQHVTFTLEREFAHPPAHVFAAWAERKAKERWFAGPTGQWKPLEREMDFRVGGRERARGQWTGGRVSDFQAQYHDIVQDKRIVYSYSMHVDDKKISVSLATIEFEPAGKGTKLILTEQGAFLDGYDDAGSRERGTGGLLDALEKSLGGAL
jgi:uncharacterized protein YndB with AHSA1/START domain